MKIILIVVLIFFSVSVNAADMVATLGSNSTVNDFALQCQHPAMKSNPDQRTEMCIAYIASAKEQIGWAKNTPECWKSLDDKASPMAVADGMFYSATQPDDRKMMAKKALSEIIILAAPECK